MLTEVGRVVAVEHDSLWVETVRQSSCGACAAQKACGHGLMSRMGSAGRNQIRVLLGSQRAAQYALDDQVRIGIPEQVLVHSSCVVYLLPLFCMLLLAAGLASVFPRLPVDLTAIPGAVLGFLLGIALVRLHAWRQRNNPELQPHLVARVGPAIVINSPGMT